MIKKSLVLVFMFCFTLAMSGMVIALDQPGSVEIMTVIDVSITEAAFGSVSPGSSPTVTTTVDNSGSNVNITLDSVQLQSAGTVFDSLMIDSMDFDLFTKIFFAHSTSTIDLGLTIPADATPDIVTNTIIYTVTEVVI
jgi:hypothetical protein